MTEQILIQAQYWGFTTRLDDQGKWQVLPKSETEEWILEEIEDRWLLIINNVPQVNLTDDQALCFLKRIYWASFD